MHQYVLQINSLQAVTEYAQRMKASDDGKDNGGVDLARHKGVSGSGSTAQLILTLGSG
jgi:hypothetical protein